MRRTSLIHLRKIESSEPSFLPQAFRYFRSTPYDDSRGFGFIRVDKELEILSATLVLQQTTYRTIFDPEELTFLKEKSANYEEIPFKVDGEFGTLEVFSSARNVAHAVNALGQALSYKITIGPLELQPFEAMELIQAQGYHTSLRKFTLDNFVAETGISGRYRARVRKNGKALSLIRTQPADVRQITFRIDLKFEKDVELTLNQNGGIKIRCEEDNLGQVLHELKRALLRE